MRKKTLLILIIILAAAAAAGFFLWRHFSQKGAADSGEGVYAETVAVITGANPTGSENRYAGVVEAQATWSVNQNPDSTVKEIYVSVGDEVKTGDPLFIYDVETYQTTLSQTEIELERMKNERESIVTTIDQLEKEKKKAPASEQANYTIQIQQMQLDLKQKDFDLEAKQSEIDKLNENIEHATVYCEIDGVIKSINTGNSPSYGYGYGAEDQSFITVMKTGDLRVKGTVNEQNIGEMIEGQPVIVTSRVDPEQTWRGTITSIDRENTEQSGGGGYYGGGDAYSQSSSHPFYVDLDSSEGLMMGQHVYIQVDYSDGEEPRKGIWLDEYMIVMDDPEHPFVWAANANDRIEKRAVKLGEHDEEMMQYEILEGLTLEDKVAWPDETVKEGMRVLTYEEMMEQMTQDMEAGDGMTVDGENGGMLYDGEDGGMIVYDDGAAEGGMDMNDLAAGEPMEPMEGGAAG